MSNTTIYLVRHAQSLGNAAFDQGLPTPKDTTEEGSDLSEMGFTQAATLAQQLKDIPFTHAYSSNLLRAKRTTEILLEGRDIPFTVVPELKERVVGSLGGKSSEEVRKEFPFLQGDPRKLTTEQMWEWKLFPDMETAREAVHRVKKSLDTISTNHIGETVLVVSHGNIMRTFLVEIGFGTFLQLRSGTIKNCSFAVLENSNGTYTVKETQGIDKFESPEDIVKIQPNEQI